MNNCTFAGYIGNDAELRYTTGGKAVCGVSIAVNRPPINGVKQKPLWVKASWWQERAEKLCPYLKKGTYIVVSGAAELREWQSNDGEKHTNLEIPFVQNMSFGGGGKSDGDNEPRQQRNAEPREPEISDEDIPF